jgi:hypothetical protein
MSIVTSSYKATTTTRVNLPYDVINIILKFLSQITNDGESGYYIEINKHGKIRLLLRPSFTGIFDITRFKQTVSARYVQLVVQQWTPNGEPAPHYTVTALEQPHRIHTQATIEENYRNGFVADNRCYTYIEPETENRKIAYVESRIYHAQGNMVFHQGCIYGENDEWNVVSEFNAHYEHAARIIVNPFNMIWDVEGDDHWADNLELAAEALLELGDDLEDGDGEEEEDEIDFDALPPLQMYL